MMSTNHFVELGLKDLREKAASSAMGPGHNSIHLLAMVPMAGSNQVVLNKEEAHQHTSSDDLEEVVIYKRHPRH